ncbi:MAG: hypothetical protein E6G60_03335 [Actinobacteria bacterium]|nr:MAG: hypothetical protein E6G60_03335 [Actinomycetota bacterium]
MATAVTSTDKCEGRERADREDRDVDIESAIRLQDPRLAGRHERRGGGGDDHGDDGGNRADQRRPEHAQPPKFPTPHPESRQCRRVGSLDKRQADEGGTEQHERSKSRERGHDDERDDLRADAALHVLTEEGSVEDAEAEATSGQRLLEVPRGRAGPEQNCDSMLTEQVVLDRSAGEGRRQVDPGFPLTRGWWNLGGRDLDSDDPNDLGARTRRRGDVLGWDAGAVEDGEPHAQTVADVETDTLGECEIDGGLAGACRCRWSTFEDFRLLHGGPETPVLARGHEDLALPAVVGVVRVDRDQAAAGRAYHHPSGAEHDHRCDRVHAREASEVGNAAVRRGQHVQRLRITCRGAFGYDRGPLLPQEA